MTAKSDRRDAKRKQREKSRRMRGNRWIFLRNMLSVNRYHEAGTMKGLVSQTTPPFKTKTPEEDER